MLRAKTLWRLVATLMMTSVIAVVAAGCVLVPAPGYVAGPPVVVAPRPVVVAPPPPRYYYYDYDHWR